jgi:uncharacterized small protein (TIGR04563 family)
MPSQRLSSHGPTFSSTPRYASRMASDKTDKRKQSLYFPETMLDEIKLEAQRLNRSLSWVVQRAWKVARVDVKKLPSVNDVDG